MRGICALRPGAEGFSENIVVRSILGRFLEHSRIFHFNAINEFWIGSADMMHRNLDRRVEVMAQVKDPKLTAQLDDIFESALDPSTRCWELGSDGQWTAAPHDGQHRPRSPGIADGAAPASVTDGQHPILAAGAVMWRSVERPAPVASRETRGVEVAIIHRPRYDDWSLPKGKLDPGRDRTGCRGARDLRGDRAFTHSSAGAGHGPLSGACRASKASVLGGPRARRGFHRHRGGRRHASGCRPTTRWAS